MTASHFSLEDLRNRKIALLGMGLENRALARFFLSRGLTFSICDARGENEFVKLRREWGEGVEGWHLGEHYLQRLDRFERIFRTPGVRTMRPELQRAKALGTHISSQTRLFFTLSSAPILGITGTKGKGTTAALSAAILQDGPRRRVKLGGNIGAPPIDFVDELTSRDLVVLELSSFQLQDLDSSPQFAVVLGITEDHLDYHADPAEYVEAKKSICRYQGETDILIVNQDCARSRAFAAESRARPFAFSTSREVEAGAWIEDGFLWLRRHGRKREAICALDTIPLKGEHNHGNAAAAAAAAAVVGAPAAQIASGIQGFAGLPHRLERVGERAGVLYYDDSMATTPDAAIAAIRSFEEPLILIAGGAAKGADFSRLGAAIAAPQVKAVILLGEEGKRIEAAIARGGGFGGKLVTGCKSMAAAMAEVRRMAQRGDVVLLAPGCASFGMFADYADRGRQFRRLAGF